MDSMIFNGPMIQALLDGRKTQTRRIVKPQPKGAWAAPGKSACPYGRPGDLLWVRETWQTGSKLDHLSATAIANEAKEAGFERGPLAPVFYPVDGKFTEWGSSDHDDFGPWGRKRSSRFMPRWASRLTLRIKSVRVERVQDISSADAQAEGARLMSDIPVGTPTKFNLPP